MKRVNIVISKKTFGIIMMFIIMVISVVNANTLSASITSKSESVNWQPWTSGQQTINFKLNNIDTTATVSLPGAPPVSTGYHTNANQFGVILKMNNKTYTYTFADGSSESSGVFFAIEGNGNASPYVLKPNFPNIHNFANPNVVLSDYEYYYADNKVKEVSVIELASGEKLLFTQILEFKNSGVFHHSSFQNIGNEDIEKFRIINKIDTFLENDYVPVFYGESLHTYYIKPNNSNLKLRISGLTGIDGSVARKHVRIWDLPGFTGAYRNYRSDMEPQSLTDRQSGTLAYQPQWPDDSEIVYDQIAYTLKVGETGYSSYAINFLQAKTVTVQYQDENGIELAESEFLSGELGDPYQSDEKSINGYTLVNTIGNTKGVFEEHEQLVTYVFQKSTQETFTVKYHGNGSTGGQVPVDNKEYNKDDLIAKVDINLSKKGYKFKEWNTLANGSGITWNYDKNKITSNLNLYAIWEKNPSGSEDSDEGDKDLPTTGNDMTGLLLLTLIAMVGSSALIIRRKNDIVNK